jgi:hypothetical protein
VAHDIRTLEPVKQRLGQFDLTGQEVHADWTAPLRPGYGRDIGIAGFSCTAQRTGPPSALWVPGGPALCGQADCFI